jgi:hypothetical protein
VFLCYFGAFLDYFFVILVLRPLFLWDNRGDQGKNAKFFEIFEFPPHVFRSVFRVFYGMFSPILSIFDVSAPKSFFAFVYAEKRARAGPALWRRNF